MRVLALVLLLAVSGCGGQSNVRSLTFSSGGRQVAAYVVTPGGGGRHAAVVLVHGSGGDRDELLPQAKELARLGFVALTLTEPSTSRPPARATSVRQLLEQSRDVALADVAAARRAADTLAARKDVDPARLGYLGWSAGAKTGALVAAADSRFRALALLSAGADTVERFAVAAPPAFRAAVRRDLAPVDPIAAIARVQDGRRLLLEDGTRDRIVPREALENVVHAAPQGTTVRWYAADHALTPKAYRDAESWLAARLMASARP